VIEHFPRPPDWRFDWDALYDEYPWVRSMAETEQDSVHHAEGDVWTHTRMVCEAMLALEPWREAPDDEKAVLLTAAFLHDIAKPATTRREDGRITARGHSVRGAIDIRTLLWDQGVSPRVRERIASLVRFHQVPFFLIEKEDARRLAYSVSQSTHCRHLAMVAEADARGRICADLQRLLDNIALFREFCREHECLEGPRRFPSDHSRFLYFRKEDRDPDYLAFDDTRCEVVLMSGLPGAGKDAWVAEHLPGWPVISLDDIRRELKIKPTDKQGLVITRARERAKEYLRKSTSFVWNATNVSRQMRERAIGLFATYNARVRIVYVEAPAAALWRQNRDREETVPASVIRAMMERWEVPDLTEAHEVIWASESAEAPRSVRDERE
jgi:putative nucleotidyltransferase with HDIG domain